MRRERREHEHERAGGRGGPSSRHASREKARECLGAKMRSGCSQSKNALWRLWRARRFRASDSLKSESITRVDSLKYDERIRCSFSENSLLFCENVCCYYNVLSEFDACICVLLCFARVRRGGVICKTRPNVPTTAKRVRAQASDRVGLCRLCLACFRTFSPTRFSSARQLPACFRPSPLLHSLHHEAELQVLLEYCTGRDATQHCTRALMEKSSSSSDIVAFS